jgi:hypothetical protein
LVLVWVDVPVWILVGIAVGGVDFAQGGVFFDFYEDGEEAGGVGPPSSWETVPGTTSSESS